MDDPHRQNGKPFLNEFLAAHEDRVRSAFGTLNRGGTQSGLHRRRLEVDDVVHAAALSGLKYHLKHAGDEIGLHVTEVCEGEPIARLGLEDIASDGSRGESA